MANFLLLNPLFPSNHFREGELTIFVSDSRYPFKADEAFLKNIWFLANFEQIRPKFPNFTLLPNYPNLI